MAMPRPGKIEYAMTVIDPVFLHTPVRRSAAMDRAFGLELLLKDETATPIRSFKGRGGCVLAEGVGAGTSLVCASAGNFGQGLAWACRSRGIELTVFAARSAVASKIEAMRGFGARVILAGADFDEAKEAAAEWALRQAATFVEDGAHPEISEGAGTIALELADQAGVFDAILCPLGNGALAAGVGGWVKESSSKTKVIAVCAAGAPSMALSFAAREAVSTPEAKTIADGIAIRRPVPTAVSAICQLVDEVVVVKEEHLRNAVSMLARELGLTIEPAGAAGMAALLANPSRWRGQRVAVPLCGGNI
jgi:threonine dehydratase